MWKQAGYGGWYKIYSIIQCINVVCKSLSVYHLHVSQRTKQPTHLIFQKAAQVLQFEDMHWASKYT